ncbi:MAG: hypothetical protein AB8F26_12105 [Phycisphaerales bacterium]
MDIPKLIVVLVGLYLGLGVLVGPFLLFSFGSRRDPSLAGSGKSIRVLLIPGAVAVWPVLLLTCMGRGSNGGDG